VFDELAAYRQSLGLPPAGSETDKSTIAKLKIAGQSFFGIHSGSNNLVYLSKPDAIEKLVVGG